ncbi:MAG: hypothetical protein SGARI_003711 [Bacillariaceae sp.]
MPQSSPSTSALSPYTMSLDAREKRDLPFDMQEEGPHGSNNNHNPSTPPRRRRIQYEFASEGWDYQQVLEDEDMYMDVATGQLVHPCWIEDEEDDGDAGDTGASNSQANHETIANEDEAVETPPDDEELCLDIKAPCLKRTTSGVFDTKDVESGNAETNANNAAATA